MNVTFVTAQGELRTVEASIYNEYGDLANLINLVGTEERLPIDTETVVYDWIHRYYEMFTSISLSHKERTFALRMYMERTFNLLTEVNFCKQKVPSIQNSIVTRVLYFCNRFNVVVVLRSHIISYMAELMKEMSVVEMRQFLGEPDDLTTELKERINQENSILNF